MINEFDFMENIKETIKSAGEYLVSGFRTNPHLICPDGENNRSKMYTRFDKECNEILINGLVRSFFKKTGKTEVYIFSEETGLSLAIKDSANDFKIVETRFSSGCEENKYIWVIDPICGSIPYSRGIADFIISVSLMKGMINILGFVYDPVQKELFFAGKNNGAYLNGEIINTSHVNTLSEAYVSIEHRVFRLAPSDDLQKIATGLRRLRVAGTCGLEMAYVACGRIDGLIKMQQPLYDYSAGSLILMEALKGRKGFTGLDGKSEIKQGLDLKVKNDFIASNGYIHDEISKITKFWL